MGKGRKLEDLYKYTNIHVQFIHSVVCGCVCVCSGGGEKGEVGKRKREKETVLERGRSLSASSKCMAVGCLHRLCMNTCPACPSIV